MEPLVSIIIPTFNRAHLIVKTLNSVIQQTYHNWECIIVDDFSKDKTVDVLRAFCNQDKRFKFYVRPEEQVKGAPTCRNIGLFKSNGDYVIFLDSDDTLMPECLNNRILEFQKNHEQDFLIFPMGIKKDDAVLKRDIQESSIHLIDFLNYKLPWSIMCPIWKRGFIINLKGFKEGYPRLNDPELMIRALLVPNVKYKVFNNVEYDTVYYPNITDWTLLKEKYFNSLLLFIPDICNELELRKNSKLKKNLNNYLKVWFRDFYFPSNQNLLHENRILIKMFYKRGITSLTKTIGLTIMYYSYIVLSYLRRVLIKNIIKITDNKN
ncbi:Glycosyltransferase involved in cell wall bisynthesis [Flaviramulus basaltis]|uniref:Glycosyltransferase involved in cell wall bisynthesis n=1 Tax=Flaviramulus basaltis TaxID=369401 RepID=A0A1K2IKG3_9FLAO|nr:glycosyltransferase family 2 protein [Flaviramulus basaltis]SFZ92949.1 Glycosyltransferase involved in cell wall bisynthesis [Flaviramulus basaltis]